MMIQLLPFWILFGALSAYFAHKRGRNPRYWFMIGLFMGLLGFLTLFFLPILKKEEPRVQVLPPLTLAPKNPAFDKPWFFVDKSRQRQGPIYFADLAKAWQRGDFHAESLIWCEGMPDWKKAQDIPDLLAEFNQTTN